MEPTPLAPQDPLDAKASGDNVAPAVSSTNPPSLNPEVINSGAAHINMGSILLPKKEIPGQTPASAQRINAGTLLEQEQHATLQPEEPVIPHVITRLVPSTPAEEETTVKPIETFQRDIESVVKDKNVSILTIAAAEAQRRGSYRADASPASEPVDKIALLKTVGIYALGIFFLVAASGALAYIIEVPTKIGPAPAPAPTPFISVDDIRDITISTDTTQSSLMSTLFGAKQATSLSLGLILNLLVTISSTTPTGNILTPISAQSLFALVAPNMPQSLSRTIKPDYLLGVHSYNGNQPFIIMSVNSYEQAYAGMLAWEPYIAHDLLPLFSYTPRQRIPEEGVATSSFNPENHFIQTGFVDKIVENHDARAIQNETGDITLLWTFIDRNTLVITTNDATVREIISRLKRAPITPQPGL